MNKQSLKVSILATPLMIVCGLLGSGVSALAAGSDDQHCSCSNKTLSGDYGSAVEGLILPAPRVALPIRGVVMSHNDGDAISPRLTTSFSTESRPIWSGLQALGPITSMPIAPEQLISLRARAAL
jgi:hypothetical protein